MNDGFVITAVLAVVYILGLIGGYTIWGNKEPPPVNQLSCISGPHPQNPQMMYLECEFKEAQ